MRVLQEFTDLMTRLAITRRDKTAAGQRLEAPDPTSLYWGTDLSGRLFVNVPFTASGKGCKRPVDAIVVYQPFKNKDDRFAINTNTFLITTFGFLGDRLDDFRQLEKLLSGQPIRFHSREYTGTHYTEDLTTWVEIACDRMVVAADQAIAA